MCSANPATGTLVTISAWTTGVTSGMQRYQVWRGTIMPKKPAATKEQPETHTEAANTIMFVLPKISHCSSSDSPRSAREPAPLRQNYDH